MLTMNDAVMIFALFMFGLCVIILGESLERIYRERDGFFSKKEGPKGQET